jgi:hypothetical protein
MVVTSLRIAWYVAPHARRPLLKAEKRLIKQENLLAGVK